MAACSRRPGTKSSTGTARRGELCATRRKTPEKPAGSQFNEVRFAAVKASKVRVVFTHAGKARSGVSEIFVWKE